MFASSTGPGEIPLTTIMGLTKAPGAELTSEMVQLNSLVWGAAVMSKLRLANDHLVWSPRSWSRDIRVVMSEELPGAVAELAGVVSVIASLEWCFSPRPKPKPSAKANTMTPPQAKSHLRPRRLRMASCREGCDAKLNRLIMGWGDSSRVGSLSSSMGSDRSVTSTMVVYVWSLMLPILASSSNFSTCHL